MAIRFLEDRLLLLGGQVKKGDERTFSPEEEAAFIANGVAEAVKTKAVKEDVNG